MNISPRYNATNWIELKLTTASSNEDWKEAINIFDNRYSYRFIKQIDTLRFNSSNQTRIYSGFVIMSINCLLIETLNQFYYGVDDTDELKKDKNIKHINSIKDSFIDFLTSSKYFNPVFDKESSILFYDDIRCGLLHQAKTKKSSIIHIKKSQKQILEKIYDGKKITGISIRRDLFTDALVEEYENYKKTLLTLPVNEKLRKNFITKMNLICDENK
jgi:hypothetical protein